MNQASTRISRFSLGVNPWRIEWRMPAGLPVESSSVSTLKNNNHPTMMVVIRFFSSKRKVLSSNNRPKLRTTASSSSGVEGVWYASKGAAAKKRSSLDMGRYGLKRLDYTTLEPPVWTVPPHPPTKSLAERYLFPATLLFTFGIIVWVYMNPEEDDMRDYWKRVETGQILVEDDDEDEDWDDDDDDKD